jgi:mono/diheme cytochrome c family protein
MNIKLTILSAAMGGLALAWAVSAFVARDYSKRNREIFTEMAYSESSKAQGESAVLPGGMVQQSPPEGTLYRGQYSYFAPGVPLDKLGPDDLARVKAHANPYAGVDADKRAALEAQGATLFVNNCQSCHGVNGAAGAPVAAFGIGATNLPANVGKYSDGELFHIIGYGVRTMPAHEDHVRADDRWKLILQLRKLAGGKP